MIMIDKIISLIVLSVGGMLATDVFNNLQWSSGLSSAIIMGITILFLFTSK